MTRKRSSRTKWDHEILLIPMLLVGVGIVAVDLVASRTGHVQRTEYWVAPITTVPPRTFQLLLPPKLPENTTVVPEEPIVARHPVAKVSPNIMATPSTVAAAPVTLAERRPAPTSTVTASTTVRRPPLPVDPPPATVKLVPSIASLPKIVVPTPVEPTTVPSHPVSHVRLPHQPHGRGQHDSRDSKQQVRRHS